MPRYTKLYKVCLTDDHAEHGPIHLFTLFTKEGEKLETSDHHTILTQKMIQKWEYLHSMLLDDLATSGFNMTLPDLTSCQILRNWEGSGITAYEYEHDVNDRLTNTGKKYYFFDEWHDVKDD